MMDGTEIHGLYLGMCEFGLFYLFRSEERRVGKEC